MGSEAIEIVKVEADVKRVDSDLTALRIETHERFDQLQAEMEAGFEACNENFRNIHARLIVHERCMDSLNGKIDSLERSVSELKQDVSGLKQSNERIELMLRQLIPKQ